MNNEYQKYKYLEITDLFDIPDNHVSIQSVIDKLQSLMKEGYTTAYIDRDLTVYDYENDHYEFEEHIVFLKE